MFEEDPRGQSQVIGFIIIFASLVLLAGVNQAVIVPEDNAEAEFEHSQTVQDQMVDLREKSLAARVSNDHRVSTIQLGTDYPPRYIAINPSSPSGRVKTVEPLGNGGNISLESSDLDLNNVCGTGSGNEVDTKFLEYTADYNEYGSALPITHENTVVHRGEMNPILDTGQVMVRENQLWITRYVGDVDRSGTRVESIDLLPSKTGRNFTDESINVTIPTKLSNETWDEELVADDVNATVRNASGEAVEIQMEADPEILVRCTTIGYDRQPDVDPSVEPFMDRNTTATINPTGPNTVQLIDADGGPNEANLTFENNFDSIDLQAVEARIPYTTSPGNNQDLIVEVNGNEVPVRRGPINIRPINFPSGEKTTVHVDPQDNNYNLQESGFVLEFRFQDEDGQTIARYQYFVSA